MPKKHTPAPDQATQIFKRVSDEELEIMIETAKKMYLFVIADVLLEYKQLRETNRKAEQETV